MLESIIFCVISVSLVTAFFFAWFFYQKARDKERMYLLKQGEKLESILQTQKRNQFNFVFPWLKMGIITSGMSLSFLIIGCLMLWMENDKEIFKGFLITFIIGIFLGVSLIINHFVGKNKKHGQ